MTDKWGRRLFAGGIAMLLLTGAVHSLSLIKDPVAANETERQLLDLMTNYKFDLVGSIRTMADLQRGFSISFMVSIICVGVLDLVQARERSALLKRLVLVNAIWLAVMTANSLRHFFVIPTSFLLVTLLFFTLAWLKLPADGAN